MRLPARIFVAAHTSKTYGPVQALAAYLRAAKADFHLASLPFSYSGLPAATDERFQRGRLAGTAQGHAARGWDPWLWCKDFTFVLRRGWAAGAGQPVDLFIGVDALNALAGLALRALGRTRRVAFYVIDYTPKRFGNPLLNWVYQSVDRIAATRSDVVWNLSERMRAVRRKQGVPEARNTLVPVGVELGQVKHPPKAKIRRKALLYMGALMDNKGIQLLIEAFPTVLKKVPGAELHIIGFGPFEAETRRLAAASPSAKRIHVPGGMGHEKLFREVPRYGVAFAPYLDDPGSYTWWCDPTKPKEYLACGLPLIITKVPWIWERVADARRPMGVAIDYDRAQLVAAAVKLLGDERFYWRCRRNALDFAASLAWEDIYDRAFGVEESAA
ncbi:MAG TPA: glycosyltransferase [bacterium]|nr:glycosyltransferase [bacterium]